MHYRRPSISGVLTVMTAQCSGSGSVAGGGITDCRPTVYISGPDAGIRSTAMETTDAQTTYAPRLETLKETTHDGCITYALRMEMV